MANTETEKSFKDVEVKEIGNGRISVVTTEEQTFDNSVDALEKMQKEKGDNRSSIPTSIIGPIAIVTYGIERVASASEWYEIAMGASEIIIGLAMIEHTADTLGKRKFLNKKVEKVKSYINKKKS